MTHRATSRPPARLFLRASAAGGFTLVELVIVVFIIGIMAAIAAPRWIAVLQQCYVDSAAKPIAADPAKLPIPIAAAQPTAR